MREASCALCNWAYSIDCLEREDDQICENFEPVEDEEMEIEKYIEMAEQICSSERAQLQKNIELGLIMTEMELDFDIPVMMSKAWEKENPQIIEAYRKIGNMRVF